MDPMLCLRAQPLGIFHEAAAPDPPDSDDACSLTAFLTALAEELPLQLSVVSVSEVAEDVPVYLGQGRGPRAAFVHDAKPTPKRRFRQRPQT